MDKFNSKVLLVSFGAAAALAGFTIHLLIKVFAGAFGFVARYADSDLVRHGLPLLVGFGLFIFFYANPKIKAWAEEVITEIRKVVYPSAKDTRLMTISVIIMVGISSAIIWIFDFLSSNIVKILMR